MSGDAHLLSDDALQRLFASLDAATGIVIAVSGGPDSMALMHLMARWAASGGRPALIAATVDHGLRAESAGEAASVAEAAAGLGLAHRSLAWSGVKPRTGLQEAAREARYDLLARCAREEGASHLVTAHTLDDQAETVLMRMARGSGLAGLAGMRPLVDRDDIWHARPLLGVPKADLIDLCRRQRWSFVEDPTNADAAFARTRWRRLMPLLAEEGLTAERLARLAERAARAEDALEDRARKVFAAAAVMEAGSVRLHGPVLAEAPFEIAVRVLGQALRACRSAGDHGRLQRIEACVERLRAALRDGEPLRLTLGGALVRLDRDGCLCVSPEPTRRRGRYRSTRANAAASPHSLGKGGGHA